jgi:hypothetical protein
MSTVDASIVDAYTYKTLYGNNKRTGVTGTIKFIGDNSSNSRDGYWLTFVNGLLVGGYSLETEYNASNSPKVCFCLDTGDYNMIEDG